MSVAVKVEGGDRRIDASHLLVATGRIANTSDIGLDTTGVEVDARGFIKVDERLRTLMQGQMKTIRTGFIGPMKRWARQVHGLSPARAGRWSEETSQILISMTTGYVIQRALFPDFDRRKYIADAEKIISNIAP